MHAIAERINYLFVFEPLSDRTGSVDEKKKKGSFVRGKGRGESAEKARCRDDKKAAKKGWAGCGFRLFLADVERTLAVACGCSGVVGAGNSRRGTPGEVLDAV